MKDPWVSTFSLIQIALSLDKHGEKKISFLHWTDLIFRSKTFEFLILYRWHYMYSLLSNESSGTRTDKCGPKIPSVRNVFAVLLPIFQVNGALENRTYFFKAEDCLFEFAALSKAIWFVSVYEQLKFATRFADQSS